MNKKILVTGGAGFIGAHTVVELIEAGFEPVIVDNFSNSYPFVIDNMESLLNRRLSFYKIDCCDKTAVEKLFIKENFHGAIHFAAYKAVGESVESPLKYYQNNIQSLTNITESCIKYDVKKLVFSSSCTVYGDTKDLPVSEKTATQQPNSPYGNTKKICEEILRDISKVSSGLDIICLRYFNPIGAHPSTKIGELPIGKPNNLIPFITQTAIGQRDKLTVFGNDYNTKDGTCIRDYIHVVDLANAHVAALNYENQNTCSFFNIGTGQGNTVLEVLNTFEETNNIKVNYEFGPKRPGDVESIYADTSTAEKELNWKAKYNLSDSLKHSWEWQKNIKDIKL